MKYLNNRLSMALFTLAGLFLAASPVCSGPREDLEKGIGAIEITSNTLEFDNKLKLITFIGDVKAHKDDFVINCDKMVGQGLSMTEQPDKKDNSEKFEKIVATGNVVIHRTQGGVATAEEAVYYQKEEKIVLNGSPVVKRDDDIIKGGRITLFLKEDRVVVDNPEGLFTPGKE